MKSKFLIEKRAEKEKIKSDGEESELDESKKLDYSLPATASQVFRNNFIVNKTIKKKKNVKQFIPSSSEFWPNLKSKL